MMGREGAPAIFWRFLRFGFLAWGGPVAQIALIKRELVDEDHWIAPDRFTRLLAAYQLLPGPEAHELCVHFGVERGGRIGGFAAGLGFMLPGLLLMLGLAWLYTRLDLASPPAAALLAGVQVAVIALIVRAVHRIGEHVLGDRLLWIGAAAAFAATFAAIPFWIVLPAVGGAIAFLHLGHRARAAIVVAAGCTAAAIALALAPPSAGPPVAMSEAGAGALFVAGLKAGLLTFGGAYTAIPFVRDDTVGRGWIDDKTFLDGIALGGLIPAPLIIFATFVGYVAGGLGGALAITAGIFIPAFAFGLIFYDRIEAVVESERLHRLLEAIAAAVVGMIAATALDLGLSVAQSVPSLLWAAVIFAGALALLYLVRAGIAVALAIAVGAVGGLVLFG